MCNAQNFVQRYRSISEKQSQDQGHIPGELNLLFGAPNLASAAIVAEVSAMNAMLLAIAWYGLLLQIPAEREMGNPVTTTSRSNELPFQGFLRLPDRGRGSNWDAKQSQVPPGHRHDDERRRQADRRRTQTPT
jgi:hypothetical protein